MLNSNDIEALDVTWNTCMKGLNSESIHMWRAKRLYIGDKTDQYSSIAAQSQFAFNETVLWFIGKQNTMIK